MSDINIVTLSGRLAQDPEIRSTPSGISMANFNVATSSSYEKDGKTVEKTEYIPVTAWRDLADKVSGYRKGTPVFIIARLILNAWEKDGRKYSKVVPTAISVTTMATARKAAPRQQEFGDTAAEPKAGPAAGDDDDIPF